MRQVFTSQRLETVEGVARLLQDAGIEVHISHPRSYRSRRSGQFSYAEPTAAKHQPGVWVRIPEDQPRARELLRNAGLISTTRNYSGLPLVATDAPPSPFDDDGRSRWAWRLRIGLLVVIAAVSVFIWLRRTPAQAVPDAPAASTAPASPQAPAQPALGEDEVRVRISPSRQD
jgi:hypothetical protein